MASRALVGGERLGLIGVKVGAEVRAQHFAGLDEDVAFFLDGFDDAAADLGKFRQLGHEQFAAMALEGGNGEVLFVGELASQRVQRIARVGFVDESDSGEEFGLGRGGGFEIAFD
jgi:hypothetical protein